MDDEDKSKEASKPLVLREYEFFGGCIRVKISVKNTSSLAILDAALELESDERILHFDRCEPEYPEKKGKLLLGSIYPNTDRTVAFYLDPLICAKEGTDVNCRVSFKDAFGRPDSVQMEPLKIKVVCPIFRTEQDINIGRLKELISGLQFHDSKVYTIPRKVEISELLRTCRNVIQLHDVRHIKTFKTTDEKTYEAWYYGKTKVTKKDLVIKCCIRRDTESIEVFASGNDPGDITGLLAEIGRNLTKEFERLGKVQPVFNIHIKDSIIQRSNLLSFCNLDGTCGGNVVIEDSVVQRSNIASWNEAAQTEREEAQKREKEEQERLRRLKEQEERVLRERKAREDAERRESERQKARQEEERIAKEREKLSVSEKKEGISQIKYLAVALALGIMLLGYWALAPSASDSSQPLKSTPSTTPKITATTIQNPKVTLAGGASALSNDGGGSWQYYKEISIAENSGSTLSAYQVFVQLSGSNFPTSARSDGADIRFTDNNGNELSYWIESWDYSGRSAKIWVKVPSIAASAVTTIRMYYGNPSASSASNIRTTFIFGDDFEYTDSVNNNGWTSEANNGGSIGSSTDYANSGSRSLKSYSLNGLSYVQSTLASGNIANVWFRDQTGQGGNEQAIFAFDDGINSIIVGVGTTTSATNYVTRELGTFYASSLPRSTGWHDLKIVYDGNKYYMYVDDNLLRTSSGGYGTPSRLGLGNFWWLTETFYYDDVRVRKYASSEPTLNLGAEQPVPTPTPTPISTLAPTPVTAPVTDQKTLTNSIGMEFVQIPAGEFDMGLPSNETGWYESRGPGHQEKPLRGNLTFDGV